MSLKWTSKKIKMLPPPQHQFLIQVSSDGIAKLIPQIYLYKIITLLNSSSLLWLHAAANYEENWSSLILDFIAETWNGAEGGKIVKRQSQNFKSQLNMPLTCCWWADPNDQLLTHPVPQQEGQETQKVQKLQEFMDCNGWENEAKGK